MLFIVRREAMKGPNYTVSGRNGYAAEISDRYDVIRAGPWWLWRIMEGIFQHGDRLKFDDGDDGRRSSYY
ncbi:hypothetical protein WCLP8_4410008 [uncultured Gammaproteobacteria bacterium]